MESAVRQGEEEGRGSNSHRSSSKHLDFFGSQVTSEMVSQVEKFRQAELQDIPSSMKARSEASYGASPKCVSVYSPHLKAGSSRQDLSQSVALTSLQNISLDEDRGKVKWREGETPVTESSAPPAERKRRMNKTSRRSSLPGGMMDSRSFFVAQSAFCAQNPFRVQNFTDFSINPKYDYPPNMKDYRPMVSALAPQWLHSTISDGVQAIKEQFKHVPSISASVHGKVTLEEMITNVCAGEYFLRWTRQLFNEKSKKYYFWMNTKRYLLCWRSGLSFTTVSKLRLRSVLKIVPECISFEGKPMYRMIVHGEKLLIFGTRHRSLFDQWYEVLRCITAANAYQGVPALWKRPTASLPKRVNQWNLRYTPLEEVLITDAKTRNHVSNDIGWTD